MRAALSGSSDHLRQHPGEDNFLKEAVNLAAAYPELTRESLRDGQKIRRSCKLLIRLVPLAGLEPAHPCG